MSGSSDRLLDAALVVVATCALIATSVVVLRKNAGGAPPVTASVADGASYASVGHKLGPAGAAVTVVEFSDFQCSFCKERAADLSVLRRKYGSQIAIVYRHFPLERIHPVARQAAIASECAARQGFFERFHDVLFANQDSLGQVAMERLARRASIPDVKKFADCIRHPGEAAAAVDRDIEAGNVLGVRATPTFLINGRRLVAPASFERLDSLVAALAVK